MTNEEILALGIQADLCDEYGTINWEYGFKKEIIAFAKLVAEKEREEIVQFIESTNLGSLPEETAVQYANLLRSYSTAIRARGQQ